MNARHRLGMNEGGAFPVVLPAQDQVSRLTGYSENRLLISSLHSAKRRRLKRRIRVAEVDGSFG
jgi:hypothetical protein